MIGEVVGVCRMLSCVRGGVWSFIPFLPLPTTPYTPPLHLPPLLSPSSLSLPLPSMESSGRDGSYVWSSGGWSWVLVGGMRG